MRVNIKPDTITRDTMTVPAAQVHLLWTTGEINLTASRAPNKLVDIVMKRNQLKGSV